MDHPWSSSLTTVANCWYWVGPASMTMSTPPRPRSDSGVVGTGCRGVATMAMTSGAGRSRSTSRTIGCDGHRRAISPDGETSPRTSPGSL